jgi:uncharacterized protein
MNVRIRAATIALLVLVDLPFTDWIVPGNTLASTIGREVVFWVVTLVIIAFVTLIERRPLSSIGIVRPTWRTAVFGIAGGAVMLGAIVFVYSVIYPLLHVPFDAGATSVFGTLPPWLNAAIVIRAAVFEEVFYRGFAIERLSEILASRKIAALISWAAFTLAHLSSWGWAHLIVAGSGGIVLTVLYLWRRDLPCCMLAHAITDGVGVLLA